MGIQMVDSIELAEYIVAKLGLVNHLKLQKLVYYAEAYHLAYFDKSIIEDNFEAWLHGPVSRKLWNHFKPIANVYDNIPTEKGKRAEIIKSFKDKIAPDQLGLLDDVLAAYGKLRSYDLECLTHEEDPWRFARKGYSPDDKCEEIIDKKIVKKYYKRNLYSEQNQAR